jgi:hypothetical protein
MKHLKSIEAILAKFHEPWMSDAEKEEMTAELLKSTGTTLERIDADIETGVINGHSVENQLEILERLLRT